MSTILRSLQKLEKEKEAARYASQIKSYSGPGAQRPSAAGSYFGRRVWVKLGFAGLILLAVAAAGLYFRHSRHQPRPQAELPGDGQSRPASILPSNGTSGSKAASAQKQRASLSSDRTTPFMEPKTTPAAARPPLADDPAVQGNGQHPRDMAPSEPAVVRNEETAPQSRMPLQAPSDTANPGETRPSPNQGPGHTSDQTQTSHNRVSTSPATAAPDEYQGVLPLTDGRLKVQAIAWSQDKQARMVVMNNRILHEGDSVDAFIVIAVRQDDVVVREKDAGMWRVVFGRP